MSRVKLLFAFALVVLTAAATFSQGQAPGDRLTADVFSNFALRSIGPTLTTGRVADFDVDPKNPSVYCVATAAGGLWKSDEPRHRLHARLRSRRVVQPVLREGRSEELEHRVARHGRELEPAQLDDSATASTSRRTAARRGRASGSPTSEHIGNIQIDPRDSNVVYIASQGPLWSSGGERGVYKTTDGGKTWTAILTASPDTGANEVLIDPANPDVLYAAMWQRRRATGQFVGGGPESGIHKSTNGGKTWTKLAGGLPKGDMGRINIGVDGKVQADACLRDDRSARA